MEKEINSKMQKEVNSIQNQIEEGLKKITKKIDSLNKSVEGLKKIHSK